MPRLFYHTNLIFNIMKKTIYLLTILLFGCKCLTPQNLPIQIIDAGPDCTAPLPDYKGFFTARDNCGFVTLIQDPAPGLILTPGNPYVQITIIATDFSSNTDKVVFDVLLQDTIPPAIEIDTSFYTITQDQWSKLSVAYHNQIGRSMDAACRDYGTFCDSTFYKKSLLSLTGPGYNRGAWGTFIDPGLTVIPVTDDQLEEMGFTTYTLQFIDPTPTPLTIDAGQDTGNWFIMLNGNVSFNYLTTGSIPEMYKSERFGNFSYRIPIGTGYFNIELHFAEIFWHEPGKRIFSVTIEGKPIPDLTAVDLYDRVGFANPYVKTLTNIWAIDGYLDLVFSATIDYAKLSGIVITKVNPIQTNL